MAWAAVVLTPVGVIATIGQIRDYKFEQELTDLELIRSVVQQSSHRRHRLPSEAEGLESLAQEPDPMLERVPNDPWRHGYVYRRTQEAPGFVVYSVGQDGIDDRGAGDDVTTRDKPYRCETYYDECAGSLPWWRDVAFATTFLAGLAWLLFSAVRVVARRLRARRAA
jgi:hypothetical protein